jgi:hypothetical protein
VNALANVKKRKRKIETMFADHTNACNLSMTPRVEKRENTPRPLQWGLDNEDLARRSYMERNPELSCVQTGMFVSADGALGASPDGIIYRCPQAEADCISKDPKRWKEGELLEIKCPWSVRHLVAETPEETMDLVVKQLGYLNVGCSQGYVPQVQLNRANAQGHKYYHQIMCAMNVTGIHKCHFVVWTPHVMFSIGYVYDEWWGAWCIKLTDFWFEFMRHTYAQRQKKQLKLKIKKRLT